MKEIDFTLFLGSDKVSDYISFVKHQLQLLKRFKSYKFLLHERIMNFNFSDREITEKQLEIFEFKIDKEENLFCIFYFEYEKLKTFSYEEKIKASINLFFDTLWKTSLPSFQTFTLQNRFLEDYKEFDILSNQEHVNHTLIQNNIDLSKSLKLKEIFKDEKLFNKINFSKLKEHDVVYSKNSENLVTRSRAVPDILILLSYLSKINLIDIEHGNDYLSTMLKILDEVLNEKIDSSRISKIYNGVVHGKGRLSKFDIESLNEIKVFINQYI